MADGEALQDSLARITSVTKMLKAIRRDSAIGSCEEKLRLDLLEDYCREICLAVPTLSSQNYEAMTRAVESVEETLENLRDELYAGSPYEEHVKRQIASRLENVDIILYNSVSEFNFELARNFFDRSRDTRSRFHVGSPILFDDGNVDDILLRLANIDSDEKSLESAKTSIDYFGQELLPRNLLDAFPFMSHWHDCPGLK